METLRSGLSSEQVEVHRARDGPNVLPPPERTPPWRLAVAQLTHFFAVMLWVAAALALVAGLPPLAVAIVVIVLLNAAFAFAQEHRADRATEALGSLMPSRARVVRDGTLMTVAVSDLVRDDLLTLNAGDRVPADVQVVTSHGIAVDESMLTGESLPAPAPAGATVYAGTFVVEGDGTGLVTEIGAETRLAAMAALTEGAERPPSPLDLQLHRLVVVIALLATTVGVLLAGATLLMGIGVTEALLFGVGVTVALVPEGLLPTVTLSLARGAQQMAGRDALVRHLESVETLGATTFVCTDKTGTLTRNEMAVLEAWTPGGVLTVRGTGYVPEARVTGAPEVVSLVRYAALGARACVVGRIVRRGDRWVPEGDPMEVALDVLALRLGGLPRPGTGTRMPFTSQRMCSAAVVDETAYVLGAPEVVLARCTDAPEVLQAADVALTGLTDQGRRVMAVARRPVPHEDVTLGELETLVADGLELVTLLGIEDPPRTDVAEAITACHRAGIRVAMVTGDNLRTAAAIAREVGLLRPGGILVEGADLPAAPEALAALLDRPEGAVVARVTPSDKLRIAQALHAHGHVVAMTGDGVNDAAALRGADVGVAMGRSGSDVARAAADLVLLDDHFATIVRAVELGRSTFANIRRFLTYHLTDNVAELVPFVVWALTGSSVPLAIGVIQVLALDNGTDMLPAVALGAEPPSRRTMDGPRRTTDVVDGSVLRRALLVLGPTEAVVSMAGFLAVLSIGGWSYGATPEPALLASASGTAFATIAVMQMANAFACRSETATAWFLDPRTNRLLLAAVAVEAVLLVTVFAVPWLADLLGGSWPPATGWVFAAVGAVALLGVDALHKLRRRRAWRASVALAAGRSDRRSHRPA